MSDFELRRRLQTLREDREPSRDLWPGLRARLAEVAREPVAAAPRPRSTWPWAAAAAVIMGLGLVLTARWMPAPVTGDAASAVAGAPWSLHEAQLLGLQYDGAYGGALGRVVGGLRVPTSPQPLRPELDAAGLELDAARLEIERALAMNPTSTHLLDLLRRTHDQRLKLARLQARMS